MRKKLSIYSVLIIFILLTSDCFAIDDPIKEFANKITSINSKNCTLIRIIRDFNNDNIQDIAISTNCEWESEEGEHPAWGNAGGTWEIYLGQGNQKQYKLVGELFFHPLAINIESKGKGINVITIYQRLGGFEGYLKQYQISFEGIHILSSNMIKLEENEKDKKQYEALYSKLDKNPISEVCLLSQFLERPTCNWQKGYYIDTKAVK